MLMLRAILISVLILLVIGNSSYSAYAASSKVKIEGNHGKYVQCMKRIALHYKIPFNVFFAMAKTEGGWIGLYRGNKPYKNGKRTYDIGLMQINSSWIKIFKRKFDVSVTTLANNGCINILFAAKIYDYERRLLKKNNKKAGVWNIVGNYHSKNIFLQKKYILKVAKNIPKRSSI